MAAARRDIKRKETNVGPYIRKEYPSSDENFENLVHNWTHLKDDIVLFLGAGASIGAKNIDNEFLPSAYELRNEIWKKFMLRPDEKDTYDFSELTLMTLENAASLAQIKGSRRLLENFLAKRFQVDKTLWHHSTLKYLYPKSIFTTNYDNLIEIGYRHSNSNHPPIHPVFNNSPQLNNKHVPLYKPHGSIEFPNANVKEGGFVITQFDYYEIIKSRKEMLEKFLTDIQDKTVIFIGYSFMDLDISSILYNLNRSANCQCWYAVFPRNDADVRNMLREKFGIRQINRTFFDFIIDLDEAIDFIPSEQKFNKVDLSFYQN
ncbi:SIR2-like domain-containing protein [Hymenobacter gelipurpurascens]|uniref:SIR2-like domain-containing protein n=1 Tax=Hymenobacter gelipurpurascens TaxID=89968 RepID=A0A212U9S4_9BACT|nr:SIR2 family protein [Hymenobacter gelipurpurascens]SNC74956.1 SIR2-like domain-containing protein [Hymenobacter gelipurpurascens]